MVQWVSSDSFLFVELVTRLPNVFLCSPACCVNTSTFPIDRSPSLFPQCHLSFFHYLSPIYCAVFVCGDAGMSVWADSEVILQHVRQVKKLKNRVETPHAPQDITCPSNRFVLFNLFLLFSSWHLDLPACHMPKQNAMLTVLQDK